MNKKQNPVRAEFDQMLCYDPYPDIRKEVLVKRRVAIEARLKANAAAAAKTLAAADFNSLSKKILNDADRLKAEADDVLDMFETYELLVVEAHEEITRLRDIVVQGIATERLKYKTLLANHYRLSRTCGIRMTPSIHPIDVPGLSPEINNPHD